MKSIFQFDVSLEGKSSTMTLEEQVSLWKTLDLSKEDLPANLDTKNVQVTVDKVTIKVNVFFVLKKQLLYPFLKGSVSQIQPLYRDSIIQHREPVYYDVMAYSQIVCFRDNDIALLHRKLVLEVQADPLDIRLSCVIKFMQHLCMFIQ